jgi:hypothetical protein
MSGEPMDCMTVLEVSSGRSVNGLVVLEKQGFENKYFGKT